MLKFNKKPKAQKQVPEVETDVKKKVTISGEKGAVLVEADGQTRAVIITQDHLKLVIELLYRLNNNTIQLSNTKFPSLSLTTLGKEMPPLTSK